ncbi:MAG: hypothetical protein ACHQ1D_00230 [Nitrososphaerales archaeon]
MKQIKYEEVVTPELLKGNLDHDAHTGFLEDYRALHCLLRKYKPKSIFEIGTNVGSGINVMATALPDAKIFSLDLDYETMRLNSKQYPLEGNGEDRVGSAAKFPYTQLRGDSMKFNYSKYPCEAYFIDGEHDYAHPRHETVEVLKLNPMLIIWHDADMSDVYNAIEDSFEWNNNYELYRVEDTRIAYAIKI